MKKIMLFIAGVVLLVIIIFVVSRVNSNNTDLSNSKYEDFTTEIVSSMENSEVEESDDIEEQVSEDKESIISEETNTLIDYIVEGPTGGMISIKINEEYFNNVESFLTYIAYPNIKICTLIEDDFDRCTEDDYVFDAMTYVNGDNEVSISYKCEKRIMKGILYVDKVNKTIHVVEEFDF